MYRKYWFVFTLILLYASLISAEKSCPNIDLLVQSEVKSKFYLLKFTQALTDLSTCLKYDQDMMSFSEDCNPCKAYIKIKNDTSFNAFYIAANGLFDGDVFQNGSLIQPFTVGDRRRAWHIKKQNTDTLSLKFEFYTEKNRVFSFSYYNTAKASKAFVKHGSVWNKSYFLNFGLLGAAFIISLVSFVSFLVGKRKDFFFYGLHAILVFIYFSGIWLPFQGFLDYEVGRFVEIITQPLMYIAYVFFIREFLQTANNYVRFDHVLKWIVKLLWLVFFGLILSMVMKNHQVIGFIFTSYRLVSAMLGLYIIIYLVRAKTMYGYFIAGGMIFITIGSLMAMYFSYNLTIIGFIRPLHWMALGFIAEMIIYSAGLGYRTFMDNKEKLSYQRALITEMQITEDLRHSRESELQSKIEEARLKFVKEEKERLKVEYSLQEREVELSLLRNQMNPHFIFNSLNSIKSFIIKSEVKLAADFLTKFATLMRLILANSKKKEVTIEKEIQAIELYLELEKVRLQNMYDYEIIVSDEIDVNKVMIQPLILQPFVENAIWHGIRNKKGKGKVVIKVGSANSKLKIEISDDGVGRLSAKKSDIKKTQLTKSYGLEITRERLEKHYQKDISIQFSDLNPGSKFPGTLVIILLPVEKNMHG